MFNSRFSPLSFGAIKYTHEGQRPLKAIENHISKALNDSPELNEQLTDIENAGINAEVHTQPDGINSKVWFSFSKDKQNLVTPENKFTYNCMFQSKHKNEFARTLLVNLIATGKSLKKPVEVRIKPEVINAEKTGQLKADNKPKKPLKAELKAEVPKVKKEPAQKLYNKSPKPLEEELKPEINNNGLLAYNEPQTPAEVKLDLEKIEKRNQLIEQYYSMATGIAGFYAKKVPEFVPFDEILTAAEDGLFDAASKYKPETGVNFKTYAQYRINGSIKDRLRNLDHVSVNTREKYKEIQKFTLKYKNEHFKPPTFSEIAAGLELPQERVESAIDKAENAQILSLHSTLDGSDGGELFINTLKDNKKNIPLAQLEKKTVKIALTKILPKLNEKQRQTIEMYYYEDMPLREIGKVMGITESRVSQLHTAALIKLKKYLNTNDVTG